MCADAILDLPHRDDVVLDPFLGSGTILIAKQSVGRRCYGIELDPRYIDVALCRYREIYGKSAILESTGETFEEVERRGKAEATRVGPQLLAMRRAAAASPECADYSLLWLDRRYCTETGEPINAVGRSATEVAGTLPTEAPKPPQDLRARRGVPLPRLHVADLSPPASVATYAPLCVYVTKARCPCVRIRLSFLSATVPRAQPTAA